MATRSTITLMRRRDSLLLRDIRPVIRRINEACHSVTKYQCTTEPNLPNTEASVRYYSVRFGRIQKYRTESQNCSNHFEKVP